MEEKTQFSVGDRVKGNWCETCLPIPGESEMLTPQEQEYLRNLKIPNQFLVWIRLLVSAILAGSQGTVQ